MKTMQFEEHLSVVLGFWPEEVDVATLLLPENNYGEVLNRSVALRFFYEKTVEIQTLKLDSSIQRQLDWIVFCMVSGAMKKGLRLICPQDLNRDELKHRLDALFLKSALPQLQGKEEADGSFDLDEVRDYLISYGLITSEFDPLGAKKSGPSLS